MKTIYKYSLSVVNENIIEMPEDSKILSVQMQNSIPTLWALVDTDSKVVNKTFEIYGTGHEIVWDEIARTFIGTFQMQGGSLVFHLFEKSNKEVLQVGDDFINDETTKLTNQDVSSLGGFYID